MNKDVIKAVRFSQDRIAQIQKICKKLNIKDFSKFIQIAVDSYIDEYTIRKDK